MSMMREDEMNLDFSGSQLTRMTMRTVLKEKRLILGLTQKQVADKANLVLQQYQKFESGERSIMNCSFELACRIIEALDMDICRFYHGEYVEEET